MIIDIHTHTYPTSIDSQLSAEELIKESKRLGLDGICITDHDGFWDHEEVFELSREHDYLVLPGCEVTTEEGHLLVYGLSKYIFGMHRASVVKQMVDEVGGVIVVAHPYRRVYRENADKDDASYDEMLDRAARNEVFGKVNAVEVLNSRGSDQENAFSLDVARRFGLKGTGASDAHKLADIGTFATDFERPISCLEEFIEEIKAGRFSPVVMSKQTSLKIHT
ncbi:MAG: PHP domain-containing protein [Chloroflexi bacterium]|nr:PHP domain-containing protein [Chloroflexota bacterium]